LQPLVNGTLGSEIGRQPCAAHTAAGRPEFPEVGRSLILAEARSPGRHGSRGAPVESLREAQQTQARES